MYNTHLFVSLMLWFAVSFSGFSQNIGFTKSNVPFHADCITIYRLNADSLTQEKQNIVVAEYKKEALRKYKISIAFSDSALHKTSSFGEDSKALVAINGGFFDVVKGGSTTLWVNDGIEKRILNHPSDKTGERPVSNIIYIK